MKVTEAIRLFIVFRFDSIPRWYRLPFWLPVLFPFQFNLFLVFSPFCDFFFAFVLDNTHHCNIVTAEWNN